MGRQKIKNPASSAGHNRQHLAALRETRQELPGVARKVPHSRILRLPYRSDRDSPEWHRHFGKCPNRESVYLKHSIRQAFVKNILQKFPQACGLAAGSMPIASYKLDDPKVRTWF
jgi:hypothetical protein